MSPGPLGSVTIDGTVYEHDVLIRLGGKVEKRKKKLSKAVYGTSHTISLVEARQVYQKHAARLLIGAGSTAGSCCRRRRPPISSATAAGGASADARGDPGVEPGRGAVIGLLHVTC